MQSKSNRKSKEIWRLLEHTVLKITSAQSPRQTILQESTWSLVTFRHVPLRCTRDGQSQAASQREKSMAKLRSLGDRTKIVLSRFLAISLAAQNGLVSGHLCRLWRMIWGRLRPTQCFDWCLYWTSSPARNIFDIQAGQMPLLRVRFFIKIQFRILESKKRISRFFINGLWMDYESRESTLRLDTLDQI